MKILLVSDSHSHDELLKKIANKHNDCDLYIHCGDSQSSKENIYPFVSVRGNCDFYSSDFSRNLVLISPLGKIYVEHIPFFLTNINELKKKGFVLYLHGHTHVKKDEIIDGIRIINPGSLAYPRDNSKSYAIVTIDKKISVEFYDI